MNNSHSMKARMVRIFHGEKGMERYETTQQFNAFMNAQDFQGAIDYLATQLDRLDTAGNEYKTHTAGYYYGMRGYAYCFSGELDKAISDEDRAIAIVPKWSMAYYIRGLSQYYLGDYQAAVEDYTRAIEEKNKADVKYFLARADAYWASQQLDDAIADYTECIKRDKKYTLPYIRRGLALQKQQDTIGARKDFEKAIMLDPNMVDGYLNLAWMNYKQDDQDAALDVIRIGMKANPGVPALYEAAGYYLLEKGDYLQAIDNFTKCLEMDDANLQSMIGNAVAYYYLGDKENSQKYFDQARQHQPLLNNGQTGIGQLSQQCLVLTCKEKEALSHMVEEFK